MSYLHPFISIIHSPLVAVYGTPPHSSPLSFFILTINLSVRSRRHQNSVRRVSSYFYFDLSGKLEWTATVMIANRQAKLRNH